MFYRTKENEVGGTFRVHEGDKKRIHSANRRTLREETTWEA